MKSNYIIAYCVYTLIKSVDAITLLVIHHSTEITIAVNFTFIFSWFTLKRKAFSLLALAGGWSGETLQGSQHPTAPITAGRMWGGDYCAPTLIPSGETCPSWGLPVLPWDVFKTICAQLPLKVPLISTDCRSLGTCALRALKPDQLKCLHPSSVVVCRRGRVDGP